jgi:2-polyprenyl-3-methyl-5-hydroxy-6-metoxy-1,4-benzoquinol methylase
VTPSGAAPQTCIACGALPRRAFRLRGGVRLEQCPRCHLGWWNWPPFDPGAFYDQGYFQGAGQAKGYDDYAALEAGVAHTARSRLRRITGILSGADSSDITAGRPRRMLELGCGTGVFLDVARQAGWQVEGVEVSAYAGERARERGLAVNTTPVEDLRPTPGAYDCVALWDVIEHVRDPAAVLHAAARALRPGGVLALSTGDVTSLCAALCGPRWHLFNLPEHLFFFSPEALRRLLAQAGGHIVHVTREVNWVPVAYVWERLRKTEGILGHIADRCLRNATLQRMAPWLIPATLLDVLGVYARRT